MAAIQPDSTILIYHGMPLDNNYEHTLYFASKGQQYSWFSSANNVHLKHTFTKNTYQRVNSGVFEARIKADELYDCNYMAFKNTSYGSKWFFAFINSVEYINNENSFVNYEIDVIQTYLYDGAVLEQCFIEREHTVTDEIGDNILPEPVDCGEYVFADYDELVPNDTGSDKNALQDYKLAVLVCDTGTGATVNCRVYDEVVAGGYITVYNTDQNAMAALSSQLEPYAARPEAIVAMYMLPRLAIGNVTIPDGGAQLASTYHGKTVDILKTALVGTETFGSYQPKNKKMYTYPYNYYHVDNGNGDSAAFRYEFFYNHVPRFTVQACVLPPIQIKLVPVNYKGISGNHRLFSEFLTIAGYPLCSWNYDSYKAWQAQNAIPTIIKAGVGALGLALAPFTAGASLAATVAAGASLVSNAVSQQYTASIQADVCKGNIAAGNVNFSHEEMQFYAGRCCVQEQTARMIDQYFTQYGYKVNRLGMPSLNNRPHYTYVKTVGCSVKGMCPADAGKKIGAIFDHGITFWINESEVGNYSVDNSPATQGD